MCDCARKIGQSAATIGPDTFFQLFASAATKHQQQQIVVADKTSEIVSTTSTIVLLHRALFCCLGNRNYFNQAQLPAAPVLAPFKSVVTATTVPIHPINNRCRNSNDNETVFWHCQAMSSNLGASGGALQPSSTPAFQIFGGPGAAVGASGSANVAVTTNNNNKNNDSSCSSSNTEDSNEIEDRRRRIKNRTR